MTEITVANNSYDVMLVLSRAKFKTNIKPNTSD